MRGSKAKAMRKYVTDMFPYLSTVPLYRLGGPTGEAVVLDRTCQRHHYQSIKRTYKKTRRENSPIWRMYNARKQRKNQ